MHLLLGAIFVFIAFFATLGFFILLSFILRSFS